MLTGTDYRPFDTSHLQEKSYDRWKTPQELTSQERMSIYVLEQELEKDDEERRLGKRHLDDEQRYKIEHRLYSLREKERFRENKEAVFNIKIREEGGFKEADKDKEEIARIEKELSRGNLSEADKTAKKQKLKELRETEAPLDSEQFKILIKDILEELKLPELKKFLSQHCIFDLDKKLTEGISFDPTLIPQKFLIKFSPRAFYDESKTKVIDEFGLERSFKFLNPGKAAFLLGQVLGHLFIEPDNWKEVAPQIKFTEQGEVGSWGDFVALCVSNPDQAEKIFPEAYRFFRKNLEGVNQDKIKLAKEKKTFTTPKFTFDFRSEEEKKASGAFGGLDNAEAQNGSFIKRFIKKLGFLTVDRQLLGEGVMPRLKEALWKQTDWAQRAISEYESKEVSRIITRNEGIMDRDRALTQLLNDGKSTIGWEDRLRLRTILLADMKFDDFSRERLHIYLQACDYLYRKTNGEEITEESYQFLTRLCRVANEGKRLGTKPCEYKKIDIGTIYWAYDNQKRIYVEKRAQETKYIRDSNESLMERVLEENATFTLRNLSECKKETFEYMRINDHFIDIDERWGLSKPGYKEGEEYDSPTLSFDRILGAGFRQEMFKNYNARERLHKLNPDQIAMIARIICEEIRNEKGEQFGIKNEQSVIKREHARGIMIQAYHFYRDKFLQDDTYRGYINYFFKQFGVGVNTKGELDYIIKSEDSDQDRLQKFINQKAHEKTPDRSFEEAYKISEKYSQYAQDEDPDWQQDSQGNYRDKSSNDLKKVFIQERTEKDVLDGVEQMKKAMDGYVRKIATIVKKYSLVEPIKDVLAEVALTNNEVFIAEEVSDIANQITEGTLTDEEIYKMHSNIRGAVREMRPLRREFIKLKELMRGLGIEYHFVQGDPKRYPDDPESFYGVIIPPDKNYEKDQNGKDRYESIAQKIIKDTKEDDLKMRFTSEKEYQEYQNLQSQRASLATKEKKKEKEKLERYEKPLKKWALDQLYPDINKAMLGIEKLKTMPVAGFSQEEIRRYFTAIEEGDSQELKRWKTVFGLIPAAIAQEIRNPAGQYDPDRLLMALRYSKVFLEKKNRELVAPPAAAATPASTPKPPAPPPDED